MGRSPWAKVGLVTGLQDRALLAGTRRKKEQCWVYLKSKQILRQENTVNSLLIETAPLRLASLPILTHAVAFPCKVTPQPACIPVLQAAGLDPWHTSADLEGSRLTHAQSPGQQVCFELGHAGRCYRAARGAIFISRLQDAICASSRRKALNAGTEKDSRLLQRCSFGCALPYAHRL